MTARVKSWAVYGAGAGAGLLLLYIVLPHAGPLLLGLFLAVLVDRPVTALEARGIRRGLAALLVLAGGASGLAAATVGLLSALYAEVRELAAALAEGRVHLPSAASGDEVPAWMASLPPVVQDLARRGLEAAYSAAGRWVEGVIQAVAGLPALVWPFTVTLLVAYFVSRDRRLLAEAAVRFVPARLRARAARLRGRIFSQVAAFLHAEVVVVGFSALLSTSTLFLLGAPYALSLGLLAGLLDLIPFLGPATIFGALAAFRAAQGAGGPALAAAAAGLFVSAARQLVEARVVAGRTQLHPLTVVVALYLGSRLAGPAGFLLGPVVALVAKALLSEWSRGS